MARHNDLLVSPNRVVQFIDFIHGKKSMYDDNGHGTHIAGIIASVGKYKKGYIGIAPKVKLIILKVLDENGKGDVDKVIEGMKWIIENARRYNIKLVNISMGTGGPAKEYDNQRLVSVVNNMWDMGMTVCVAAGNEGPNKNTITIPGISHKVITVGAYNNVKFKDDISNVKFYSGQGPTRDCIVKPEIIAPGNKIVSCNNSARGYSTLSGTSMATAIVTGGVALLMEKYPNMSNKDIKLRLRSSTVNIGLPPNVQGWGMINIKKLLT